jgi:hypothetical protein
MYRNKAASISHDLQMFVSLQHIQSFQAELYHP